MLKISIAKRLLLAGSVMGLMAATPAHAQLERALDIAKSSTAQSAAAQRSAENLDDRAGAAKREYQAVLQQIDNIQLFVDQQDIFLRSQSSEISSLNTQLGTVEQIKQGMAPMMMRMVIQLEDFVESDVPFLLGERRARLNRVKATLGDPSVSPAEQYRQVLNAYKIEVAYGQGLESYEGSLPGRANEVVNFLKYGRVSLIYMTKDKSEVGRYNPETGDFETLSGADALRVVKAIRIAKEQAAPQMVTAPVSAPADPVE